MASIPTQEEILAATRKSQEAMMAAVKTWLETVRTAAPKLPSKLSQVGLPFADRLLTPQDAVANAYHLAEQLLASQRKFAEDLVKATAPLRPGYRESSPEVPSRSAWQYAVTDGEPKTPAVSAAPKAVSSTEPQAADSAAPKAVSSTEPQAAVSTAPKAAVSTAPKAAPGRSASIPKAPRTTAAKRTTSGSASRSATTAPKNAAGTGARTSTPAGSARKGAGTTSPAPKDTDAS